MKRLMKLISDYQKSIKRGLISVEIFSDGSGRVVGLDGTIFEFEEIDELEQFFKKNNKKSV